MEPFHEVWILALLIGTASGHHPLRGCQNVDPTCALLDDIWAAGGMVKYSLNSLTFVILKLHIIMTIQLKFLWLFLPLLMNISSIIGKAFWDCPVSLIANRHYFLTYFSPLK